MDMKKILAAVDKADSKTKTSSNDIKKFLTIVNESATNRLSMAEQMAVQHYQEPRKDITSPVLNKSPDAKPSMIGKYFKKIEEEIAESEQRYKDRAKQLAERVVNKMQEAKNPAQQAAIAISMKKAGKKPKNMKENIETLKKLRDQISEQIKELEEYYTAPPSDSKSPIPGRHVDGCRCKEVEEGLRDPKDNPCWKGYKPVGTKKKNGREVPNCVPKEGVDESIPFASKTQKTGEAGQLRGQDKVSVKGTVLGSPEKSQKGLRGKLVGGSSA